MTVRWEFLAIFNRMDFSLGNCISLDFIPCRNHLAVWISLCGEVWGGFWGGETICIYTHYMLYIEASEFVGVAFWEL